MKALVTGFEPFGGETVNPSLAAMRALAPRIGAVEIAVEPLPVVFGRSLDVLAGTIEEVGPQIVLCVGEAGGRAELSMERIAINVVDARIPDNEGRRPVDRPVVDGAPAAYFATLPIKAAVAALRVAGLPAAVSNTAGTFVCNHVFFGLMHLAATRYPGLRGGLLHVPFLPSQAARHAGAPSMALDEIVRANGIVLSTAAARRDDIGTSEGTIS